MMRFAHGMGVLPLLLATVLAAEPDSPKDGAKLVAGYLMLDEATDYAKLAVLADHAATLPLNRIYLAFFSPTLVYIPGSMTLKGTGPDVSPAADRGFKEIASGIEKLKKGGVEVYISMGGWNYNCFGYAYARYSIGGYGEHTPNYWKLEQYGGGTADGCKAENMFCFSCEPPSENSTADSFSIFPEPNKSATWQKAQRYVENHTQGNPVTWHPELAPGHNWTDPKTGISSVIPGSPEFANQNRDPYQDFVHLAKDLGADGIDLDYEEFWHGDYFKSGTGPWQLHQTVYKYTAIAHDMQQAIDAIAPHLNMSTAGAAVGAWSVDWWGGNLHGLWYKMKQWFPKVLERIEVNVMTYDLSKNPVYHECPKDNICTLHEQVQFYMETYKQAGIPARIGFEIGTPAYPDPTHDRNHTALPLTDPELKLILAETQPNFNGAFFWQLYKPATDPLAVVTKTLAAQLCKAILGDVPRCKGSIPEVPGSVVIV